MILNLKILVKHNDRAIINLQITDLESMCKLNKQGYEVLGEIRTGGTKGFTFKTSNRLRQRHKKDDNYALIIVLYISTLRLLGNSVAWTPRNLPENESILDVLNEFVLWEVPGTKNKLLVMHAIEKGINGLQGKTYDEREYEYIKNIEDKKFY